MRDSPFEYVVLPSETHASQTYVVGQAVHTAIAGQQHSFSIIPKDAFANFRGWSHHSAEDDERHLDVFHASASLLDVAEGNATFSIDISYNVESGTFIAAYTPRRSGTYQLNIYHKVNGNSIHIRGSPFALEVLPGETFAQESIAFGPVLDNAVAGEDFVATIQSFDANSNMRNVGGDNWEVIVTSVLTNNKYQYGTTFDHGNGTYSLHIVPVIAGPNDLSIMMDDQHIRGSPFRLNVVHNTADGSSSFVLNDAEVSTMTAMAETTFTIQAVDVWGNKVIYSEEEHYSNVVSVQSESIDANLTQISHIGGGKYEISVTPVLSGDIQLRIILNEADILRSPLTVFVRPGEFFAETSVATGLGLRRAQAGVEASFIVQTKDRGGNNQVHDDALLNATLTLVEKAYVPVGMEIFTSNVTDEEVVVTGTQSFVKDGQHLIQYTCFEAGKYDLYINDQDGNNIAGSPFSVLVAPGRLSGVHSIITGEGTIKGVAGQISPVTVFPRDDYQNFIFDSQENMEINLTLQSRHQSKWDEDNNQMGEHNI